MTEAELKLKIRKELTEYERQAVQGIVYTAKVKGVLLEIWRHRHNFEVCRNNTAIKLIPANYFVGNRIDTGAITQAVNSFTNAAIAYMGGVV